MINEYHRNRFCTRTRLGLRRKNHDWMYRTSGKKDPPDTTFKFRRVNGVYEEHQLKDNDYGIEYGQASIWFSAKSVYHAQQAFRWITISLVAMILSVGSMVLNAMF